jgi:Na+/melibiose symporter-like transporter
MSQTTSNVRLSAAIAARAALITTVTVLVLVGLRAALNVAFGQNRHVDWRFALWLAGIFGLVTFLFRFLRTYLALRASDPVDEILSDETVAPDKHAGPSRDSLRWSITT